MSGLSRLWLVLAALFTCVNAWGAWYAVTHDEMIHAGIHVALLIPGAWLVWRFFPRRVAQY